jgi:hypothetical protein
MNAMAVMNCPLCYTLRLVPQQARAATNRLHQIAPEGAAYQLLLAAAARRLAWCSMHDSQMERGLKGFIFLG